VVKAAIADCGFRIADCGFVPLLVTVRAAGSFVIDYVVSLLGHDSAFGFEFADVFDDLVAVDAEPASDVLDGTWPAPAHIEHVEAAYLEFAVQVHGSEVGDYFGSCAELCGYPLELGFRYGRDASVGGRPDGGVELDPVGPDLLLCRVGSPEPEVVT